MTRVAVSGAGGRMGRMVCATVRAAADLELAVAYDPVATGDVEGIAITGDPASVATTDVVVEFTRPDVVMENLRAWNEAGVHVVVGTSGFDEERLAELRSLWTSPTARCLVVPNFSIGAVVMMRLAEIAAPHFAASEIIESHHDAKADAPSGTSLATAARMAAAGGRQERRVEGDELITGALGARSDGVPVHSVRLPGLLAHQEVILGNVGETLTIRHDSTDRISFMPGVLAAVRGIATLPDPVTVGLEPLLGL